VQNKEAAVPHVQAVECYRRKCKQCSHVRAVLDLGTKILVNRDSRGSWKMEFQLPNEK